MKSNDKRTSRPVMDSGTPDVDEGGFTHPIKRATTSGMTKTFPDRRYLGDGSVVVRLLYGSWAHGTQTQDSDEDWRGVFQLPNSAFLGLDAPKTTWESNPDQVYHEIGHYMRLLVKGNPNIVGMLFAPDDVFYETSGVWEALVDVRESFLTRRMASAYRGWLYGEMHNAERQGEKFPQKRLAHVPRLAYELEDAARHQYISVRQTGRRLDFIMDVKEGRLKYPAVAAEVKNVLEGIEDHIELMPEPDRASFDRMLLGFREV